MQKGRGLGDKNEGSGGEEPRTGAGPGAGCTAHSAPQPQRGPGIPSVPDSLGLTPQGRARGHRGRQDRASCPCPRRLTPAARPLPGQAGQCEPFKGRTGSSAFTRRELALPCPRSSPCITRPPQTQPAPGVPKVSRCPKGVPVLSRASPVSGDSRAWRDPCPGALQQVRGLWGAGEQGLRAPWGAAIPDPS